MEENSVKIADRIKELQTELDVENRAASSTGFSGVQFKDILKRLKIDRLHERTIIMTESNIYSNMIKMITKILDSSYLHKLRHQPQTELVIQFCSFVSTQVCDMRLRAERSNILKPIVKDTSGLSDETVLKSRVIQYDSIYKFIESFFRWEHNFQRSLKSLVIRDETRSKKS